MADVITIASHVISANAPGMESGSCKPSVYYLDLSSILDPLRLFTPQITLIILAHQRLISDGTLNEIIYWRKTSQPVVEQSKT